MNMSPRITAFIATETVLDAGLIGSIGVRSNSKESDIFV
jgi:hypothetical protein